MTRPFRSVVLCGALVVVGTVCPIAPDDDRQPAALDSRRAPYLEDEGSGRTLAVIEATLEASSDRVHLSVLVSAVGAEVDPVPGYHGIAGANHITARELGNLVAREAATLTTRTLDGFPVSSDAASAVVERGRVPERRFVKGTGFVVEGESAEEYPLAVRFDVRGERRPGEYVTDLLVHGVPRLRVSYRLGADGGATICHLESLGQDLLR